MASRTVSTLKFVGSISLGLLTGLSYTLSTLTVPTLLTLPSAAHASHAFTILSNVSLTHLRTLAGISSTSFFLAYLFSPRNQKHPYLVWTTLFVASSGLTDLVLRSEAAPKAIAKTRDQRDRKGNGRRMDASYEVVGASDRDSTSEGEMEEEVNGEEVRQQMESFMVSQVARTVVAGIGFAMSVVGIWGDGSPAEVVFVQM